MASVLSDCIFDFFPTCELYKSYIMATNLKVIAIATILLLAPFCQIAQAQGEEYKFDAEVGRLMDIIINSLYTQK